MIAKVGPLVQAGERNRYRPVVLHLIGGAAGGATAGVFLGFLGAVASAAIPTSSHNVAPSIAVCVLLTAAVFDVTPLQFPVLLHRQTPESWACALGTTPTAFAWAFDLGLGFTTRLPCITIFALPVVAVLAPSFGVSILIMLAFGLTRALVVALSIAVSRGQHSSVCNWLAIHNRSLSRLAGVGGLLCAVLLIAVVI